MSAAQMRVTSRYYKGEAIIHLKYSYSSANTWYCPSGALIGANGGTWDVGRVNGNIWLESGEDMIVHCNSVAVPDMVGYPFNEDFKNRVGQAYCWKRDSPFYYGRDLALGVQDVCWWTLISC
jgi:hypothetical protein